MFILVSRCLFNSSFLFQPTTSHLVLSIMVSYHGFSNTAVEHAGGIRLPELKSYPTPHQSRDIYWLQFSHL